jgi:glutathione peroxidase
MATDLQRIPITTIQGTPATLGDYEGKVLLVVNVASKCGLTRQYAGLEALYTRYKDRGLVVLGFPANDFLGQEPGTHEEIAEFCRSTYSVDFPLFAKIAVTGEDTHPLYRALIDSAVPQQGDGATFRKDLQGHGIPPNPEPGILWNFEKFIVGRDGNVRARYAPNTKPDDPAFVAAIEAALG